MEPCNWFIPGGNSMTDTNQADSTARSADTTASAMPLTFDQSSANWFLEMFQEMIETTLKRMLAEVAGRPAPSSGESSPLSPKLTGIDLDSIEKLKAADLRVALLIGKTPETSGLLIDTKTLARLLAISK